MNSLQLPILPLALTFMLAVHHPLSVRAQTPAFEWANLVTSLSEEHTVRDIHADPRGGFKVAYGKSQSGPILSYVDDVIESLDREGNLQWRLAILPNIKKIVVDSSGNTYVAGSLLRGNPSNTPIADDYFTVRNIPTVGEGRVYVAKISPDGILEWVRRDGGQNIVIDATGLAVDPEGNYCLSGYYTRGGAAILGNVQLPAAAPPTSPYVAPQNVFLAMYSSAGELRWVRVGESLSDYTYSGVKMDSSGSIVLSGSGGPISFNDIARNFPRDFLIKFDREGQPLWSREDGVGIKSASANGRVDFDLDSHDNILIAQQLADYSFTVSKFNREGDLIWTRPVWSGETVVDWHIKIGVRGLAVAADGSFALSGTFSGTGLSIGDTELEFLANRNWGSEAYVAKFDPTGNVEWVIQTHGLEGLEPRSDPPPRYSDVRGAAIAIDLTGGVFLIGALKGNVQFSDIVLYGPPSDPPCCVYSTIYAAKLTDPSGQAVTLRIGRTENVLQLRWATSLQGFVLENSHQITSEAWEPVSATPLPEGDDLVVTVDTGSASKFFRLRKP
jgi:hypothetical protein